MSGSFPTISKSESLPETSNSVGGGGPGGPGAQVARGNVLGVVTRSAFSCFIRCFLT